MNYGVVVVRSLQWPGAFNFYNKGETKQIYVGNGQKYEPEKSFYPVNPPEILEDPEDFQESAEPTPLESPPPEKEEGENPEGEEGDGAE